MTSYTNITEKMHNLLTWVTYFFCNNRNLQSEKSINNCLNYLEQCSCITGSQICINGALENMKLSCFTVPYTYKELEIYGDDSLSHRVPGVGVEVGNAHVREGWRRGHKQTKERTKEKHKILPVFFMFVENRNTS